jgi:hypothetical protein
MNDIDPSGNMSMAVSIGIGGAIVGGAVGYYYGGMRGALAGGIFGALAGYTIGAAIVGTTITHVTLMSTGIVASALLAVYFGFEHNWGFESTAKSQNIAVIYGDLGYDWNFFMPFNALSINSFITTATRAGHKVTASYKPDENKFIELCEKNNIVIIIGHNRGFYVESADYQDQQNNLFLGFDLGGISSSPLDNNLRVMDLPEYSGNAPNSMITANELRDSHGNSRINNPNLIVISTACRTGKSDYLANSMNATYFVGPSIDAGLGNTRTLMQHAVEVINKGPNVNSDIINNKNWVKTYKK